MILGKLSCRANWYSKYSKLMEAIRWLQKIPLNQKLLLTQEIKGNMV